jgi:phenylacetate-CoA ligase
MDKFLVTKESNNFLKSYSQPANRDWPKYEANYRFNLFQKMYSELSAYREFLKQQKFDFRKINAASDTLMIPPLTKPGYFRRFQLKDKLWPQYKDRALVTTSTSGSTGNPNYFVRAAELDWQYSILAEYFLKNGPQGSTLVIDCFGMGVWIGGLFTYQAFYYASNRSFPLTIITPGINKKEIFSALKEFAPNFKNLIFTGYPPFIKDILDEARFEGIDLEEWNCRFLFAAESFTENFRDYIAHASGLQNIYRDTLNIYGTAELGAMAFETPGSIFIRRLSLAHPEVFTELFGNRKIPTLCQYNPTFISFEESAGQLLITADNATPFCRYQVGDSGGVYSLGRIIEVFKKNKINLIAEAKKSKVDIITLPFVYVYERNDFSTTLYGLQIYPQTIKRALETSNFNRNLTGKFTLETLYNKKSDQYLKINLELKPKHKLNKKLYSQVEKSIVKILLSENSEYRELTGMLGTNRTKPKLFFWPFNNVRYFKSGIKQQWLKK